MVENLFKVLVVDDDKMIGEVCAEALAYEGYDVTVASGGWDALGLINGREWDLIVTDINMPGLDGIDFYRAATSCAPALKGKFVFMTGNPASARTVEEMGYRVVIKPFKVKDLLEAVWSVLKATDANRRCERLPLSGCCLHVRINGSELDAIGEDLSLNGMKISYAGTPFVAGPALKISIDALNISRDARVVWSAASRGAESFSGVIFEKPVPASILAGLAPNRI
mgnify:FL=1